MPIQQRGRGAWPQGPPVTSLFVQNLMDHVARDENAETLNRLRLRQRFVDRPPRGR